MNKFFINATKKLNLKPFKNSSETDMSQIRFVFKNHVNIWKVHVLEFASFTFIYLSMEKDHLSIGKLVKNSRN